MRIIGLTGGIGSGKSTVAHMLRARGHTVLDADAIYHGLIAPISTGPSPLGEKIGALFPGILSEKGEIDRAQLARKVLVDSKALEELEAVAHPAVRQRFLELVDEREKAADALVIYDVPLLYEKHLDEEMAGVIVVWVPPDIQRERLMQRSNMSEQEARVRIANQMSLDKKRDRATWVIDNSGSLEETRRQVNALSSEI